MKGSHPGAHRDCTSRQPGLLECGPYPFGKDHGALRVGACQNGQEFLPSEPSREIHLSRGIRENTSEDGERIVPGLVTVAIVVDLEVVQIEKDHRKGPAPLRRRELIVEED